MNSISHWTRLRFCLTMQPIVLPNVKAARNSISTCKNPYHYGESRRIAELQLYILCAILYAEEAMHEHLLVSVAPPQIRKILKIINFVIKIFPNLLLSFSKRAVIFLCIRKTFSRIQKNAVFKKFLQHRVSLWESEIVSEPATVYSCVIILNFF